MKVSLSWLKEYVEIDETPNRIADILTGLGLEVEEVSRVYNEVDGIVVGKVVEHGRHPNADRLSVNKVDVGNEIIDVVCGAPNCRGGLTVAVIKGGYKLPNGMEIKKSKIRGALSNGMLCSYRELGVSDEADGIIELPSELVAGTKITAEMVKADPIFTIAILPNRPDGLSVTGLAREIAAKTGKKLKMPSSLIKECGSEIAAMVKVQIADPSGCPRYSARLIKGVKIGESPKWMARRLESCGIRSINNVVDITNFVMLELGQPLHAFDYSKIEKGEILVRRAGKGEKITTLDSVERDLLESDLLICDGVKPVAIAGVMGGASSEVSSETVDILLESAYFDPVSIRKTSRRLGLISESSYRYERGVDHSGVIRALDRAATLMAEYAGGTIVNGHIDENHGRLVDKKFVVRIDRINALLGSDFTESEIKKVLESIGIVCGDGSVFEVTIPARRPDILIEEDFVEEVARLIGYERISAKEKASIRLSVQPNRRDEFRELVRDIFSGSGLTEVITNSLVSMEQLALFNFEEVPPAVINALSPDMAVLRTTMVPSLLNVVKWNKSRRIDNIAIFEVGRLFASKGAATQPFEREVISVALSGLSSEQRWDGKSSPWEYHGALGLLESIVARITGKSCRLIKKAWGVLDSAVVTVNNVEVGKIAPISALILKKFDIKGEVLYFELSLEKLFDFASDSRKYRAVSKFPSSDRDIAVVTDSAVSVYDMIDTIKSVSPQIEEVSLFDLYEGEKLAGGKKSTAFALRMRKEDSTMAEEEVEKIVTGVVAALCKRYGAVLR